MIARIKIKKANSREVPGGLVVRIPGFHCRSRGSVPGQGTEIPQASRHSQNKNQKTKKPSKLEAKSEGNRCKLYLKRINFFYFFTFKIRDTARTLPRWDYKGIS